jgi:hypothetical protein
MELRLAFVLLALLGTLLGQDTSRAPQPLADTDSATRLAAQPASGSCAVDVIHDGTIPISYGNAPVGVPWVRLKPLSARVFAVLFFSHRHRDGTHTLMHSGGWMPDGAATKILWIADNPKPGIRLPSEGKT